jgi:1,4-dihydroxy-6-naphthoate synthase
MKLSMGFSPCPNDTFIFDSLVNNKLDTEGLEFEVFLEDVQTLNEWAKAGKLDITKISYGVLPLVASEYIVLNAGGALGKGVGPLLIAKEPIPANQLEQAEIAIPGENTTAHLLFSLAFPQAKKKTFMPFHAIEDFALSENSNGNPAKHAGVIIHENRFTYQQKGLTKLMDLGEYWEKETSLPIPLGGIVVKRTLGTVVQQKVDNLIRKSLELSFSAYPVISSYVQEHAQEMSVDVMKQHIDLYVNNYSIDLGEDGKKAVEAFLKIYESNTGKFTATENLFV